MRAKTRRSLLSVFALNANTQNTLIYPHIYTYLYICYQLSVSLSCFRKIRELMDIWGVFKEDFANAYLITNGTTP